ncbi:MAG TPA: DNA polymerase IV [Ktedonobacteraceae bacterium]|nr:DNA polymerase IV [Ktedonobacteraceae bacterium]
MHQRTRAILHIDLDAFYASIEQRDQPEYRGKPVIVGGSPNRRGVVATASYEARKYGVHSAMPSRTAYRLCPQAIFLPARFEVYRAVSQQIMAIFRKPTALVEPLSLDEAYLDVTDTAPHLDEAARLASEIKRQIWDQTHLTASAGISYCKFLAKIASDAHKPDGLTVISQDDASAFLGALPIEKFFGVGKVTAAKLRELGIQTGGDLKQLGEERLRDLFGKQGGQLYQYACGVDDRPVEPVRERKSVGKEVTLERDIRDPREMERILENLALQVERRLAELGIAGRTLTLKVRWSSFELVTRAASRAQGFQSAQDMLPVLRTLLAGLVDGKRAVRLLGVMVSGLLSPDELLHVRQFVAPSLWEEERV